MPAIHISPFIGFETKLLPATETKGTRVRAIGPMGASATLAFDYGKSVEENHGLAIEALVEQKYPHARNANFIGAQRPGGGAVFMWTILPASSILELSRNDAY